MTAPFDLVTPATHPGGVRCPRCDRGIDDGQPYATTFDGLTRDGTAIEVIVCVYCTGGEQ